MKKLNQYWPLIALILVAMLGAIALAYGTGRKVFSGTHIFMGLFFCQFAMLKIFNPSGFAEGFEKYDLLAKRSKNYALAYPFIELALGLSYLSFVNPFVVYSFTIVLMGVSAIGVIKALREGLEVRCACMGTVLNVPLSTVTLTEDLGMGLMALFMLWAI